MKRLLPHPPVLDSLSGIRDMVYSAFWFAVMAAIVRVLSQTLHPFQIVFLRNGMALLILLPWIQKDWIKLLSLHKTSLYVGRGCIGLLSMLLWFTALSKIALTEATALSFTAPLFTSIAAMIFLKERIEPLRWGALIMGFCGILMILRPGHEIHPAYLLVLASSVALACSHTIVKKLTQTESPLMIVFFMTCTMTPLSLPLALISWRWPSLSEWRGIFLLGTTSNLAQFYVSRAYSRAELSLVQPFDFSRLLFVSLIAGISFNEMMETWTLIGALVIFASGLFVTHRYMRVECQKL